MATDNSGTLIKAGLAIGAMGLFALFYGGHKTMLAMKNSAPVTMKYAEWVKAPPDAEWVILEDVEIYWGYSTKITTTRKRRGSSSKSEEFFVAGNVNLEDEKERVRAFFAVSDQSQIRLIQECWAHENDLAWLAKNESRVIQKMTIEGMVQTGFDLSSEERKLLKEGRQVYEDFKIIEVGARPQGGMGAIILVGGFIGLGGGGGLLFLGIRAKKKVAAAGPPMQPGAPRRPGGPRRPGMPAPAGAPPTYAQHPMPAPPPLPVQQSGPGTRVRPGVPAPPQAAPAAYPVPPGYAPAPQPYVAPPPPAYAPPPAPMPPRRQTRGPAPQLPRPQEGPQMPRPRRRRPM